MGLFVLTEPLRFDGRQIRVSKASDTGPKGGGVGRGGAVPTGYGRGGFPVMPAAGSPVHGGIAYGTTTTTPQQPYGLPPSIPLYAQPYIPGYAQAAPGAYAAVPPQGMQENREEQGRAWLMVGSMAEPLCLSRSLSAGTTTTTRATAAACTAASARAAAEPGGERVRRRLCQRTPGLM